MSGGCCIRRKGETSCLSQCPRALRALPAQLQAGVGGLLGAIPPTQLQSPYCPCLGRRDDGDDNDTTHARTHTRTHTHAHTHARTRTHTHHQEIPTAKNKSPVLETHIIKKSWTSHLNPVLLGLGHFLLRQNRTALRPPSWVSKIRTPEPVVPKPASRPGSPRSLMKYRCPGTSLVAQWLRIRLPMQGTRVRALVQEDPTCRRATKPVRHNY